MSKKSKALIGLLIVQFLTLAIVIPVYFEYLWPIYFASFFALFGGIAFIK